MTFWLVPAIIVLLLVVYPWLQDRREEKLAEKLRNLHDEGEANALMDSAISESRREGDFLRSISRYRIEP
ncbi:MAG: hypothetical protein H7Y38_09435 [Armatimonadetes bacterium]|nr:hypothetical protein [Armatimonadota bacterium]